jgi:hypothetical protein
MPITKIRYACSVCGVEYPDIDDASKCESQGFSPKFKVGDIVFVSKNFGWYNGDNKWIANPDVSIHQKPCPNGNGNCFSECCNYKFFYVITQIDGSERDGHRVRYHLHTKAMAGDSGYRGGYTFDDGHYTPKPAENPPVEVVADGQDLIGKKANYLL